MKKLLLLIEDNPLLTGMYQAAFEKAGFEILLAHEGGAGIRLVKEKKPDAVILDLLMPGIDGFAVLAAIKADEATKMIKAIVLTSVTNPDELKRARDLGALDCLVKSDLKLAEIVEKVRLVV